MAGKYSIDYYYLLQVFLEISLVECGIFCNFCTMDTVYDILETFSNTL